MNRNEDKEKNSERQKGIMYENSWRSLPLLLLPTVLGKRTRQGHASRGDTQPGATELSHDLLTSL